MDENHYVFKLFEKQYYFELDLKEKLSGKLQMYIMVIVLVVGFLGTQWFDGKSYGGLQKFFFVLSSFISVTALVYATYCCCRSLFPYEWHVLPSAAAIEAHRVELYAFYDSHDKKEEVVNQALVDLMYKNFVLCHFCPANLEEIAC
ncbi:hypothetical protein GTA51_19540 [Desulfovibrio aerotolerans]|uniref:Uncharacterized protein n=1 Tax=Solidesulfovibrio aerotolerans TaxID=295255 RepID=A0A7C9MR76_9BACT|nr:hypothetical protein [Solidesulfovibrio aerotolerans]MYL85292.1 hypothetical protein [Solidesulfovibrio aerotolerans]